MDSRETPQFPAQQVVHDLIKGMFHKRPPPKSLVSAWDLPRALRLLAEHPFKPLDQASLLYLTRKTTFLVAAACGKRVSEIHALTTAERLLIFRASAVHLLPRAEFLAKNQTRDLLKFYVHSIQRGNRLPFSDHKQASQGSIRANSLKMDHLCH